MRWEYDFAIIGAGASGLIAADLAVKLGARVLLLEKDRIGGDCTWSGCVPSKSLIKTAAVAHAMHTAGTYGIASGTPAVDMAGVRRYLDATIAHIYEPTTPEAMRAKGMDVVLGAAAFADPHTLVADGRRITAGKVLINTGAAPAEPGIAGLERVPYFTYKNIFTLDHLPQRLVIVGGGPIGCELAQSYQRLGSAVTLVADALLPREELEAGKVLAEVFTNEGVRWLPGRANAVEAQGEAFLLHTSAGSVAGDCLLIAAGRSAAVQGLALDRAGVRASSQGIEVDRYLRTSCRHIFAAGDVLGGPQYSHLAGWQGFQAARNALLPGKNAGAPRAMPRVTFTAPEVAQVGLTEAEARKQYGDKVDAQQLSLARVDRAVSEHDQLGFLKIVAHPDGRILGGTYVGERASEAITELVVAMDRGILLHQLAGVVHPYPTYAIGLQFLATEMATASRFAGGKGRLLRAVSRWYR